MKLLLADLENTNNLGNILALNSLKQILREVNPEIDIRFRSANPLIFDMLDSDIIVFQSSGILKSDTSIKSRILLFINLIQLELAKILKKRVIFLSFSIGPFLQKWEESLVIKELREVFYIFTRESKSYKKLKKYKIKKTSPSRDLILFSKWGDSPKTEKLRSDRKITLGLTFKNWSGNKYGNVEKNLSEYLKKVQNEFDLKIIPLFIDSLPDNESIESKNYKKFKINSSQKGFKLAKPAKPRSFNEIRTLLNKLDFIISARTTSTLMSIAGGIPFLAFSKHEKVKLMLENLGLEDYFWDDEDADFTKILKLIRKRNSQKNQLKNVISQVLLRDREIFVKKLSHIIQKS